VNTARRLFLVREFERCQLRQQQLSPVIREYEQNDMPLFAESYRIECRALGEVMVAAIEELEAMDRAEGRKK
jgi:hypothetical protein